jgi:hypothetical protein
MKTRAKQLFNKIRSQLTKFLFQLATTFVCARSCFTFFFLRKQPKFNFFLFIYLTTTVRFCNNLSLVGELEVTWANFHRASQ